MVPFTDHVADRRLDDVHTNIIIIIVVVVVVVV
jgi:hypothetical protein